MEDHWGLSPEQNALVLWTLLQADCGNPEYDKELHSLVEDINCNKPRALYCQVDQYLETDGDGELESDGHVPSMFMRDILTSVNVNWQMGHAEEAAVQQVAAELREIAAHLENSAVARATQNLTRNLRGSSTKHWLELLKQEVENLLMQGVGLEHLHQERAVMVLTFTLTKEVCKRAPGMLRSLFHTAVQYVTSASTR